MTGFTCPPDHKHGANTTCYLNHRCHCGPCRANNSKVQRDNRRLKAYGRWQAPTVPATVTRNHLLVLRAAGINARAIAQLAHISTRQITAITTGAVKAVLRETEQAIRAIPVEYTPGPAPRMVPARGVHRRLQALHHRGWTQAALAAELGMECGNVGRLLYSELVQIRTHEAVVEMYDRLWDQPPTGTPGWQARYRDRAAARGWAGPLDWDDIDTDEAPASVDDIDGDDLVDEVAIEKALRGEPVTLTRQERHLALPIVHARGYSDNLMAKWLGVCEKTITRDREHLGLPANDPTVAELQARWAS